MALFVSRGKRMKIEMHAESKTYPIYLERGILKKAKEYIGRRMPEVTTGFPTKAPMHQPD